MSQATQVALAGSSALSDSSRTIPKSQQHTIPRFLLKLYEIVNDPTNESLIKWSEAGDSFHIFNQERFARELLGKWFKHQNFSSFVRQLNLYGFRKISALQQGLLRMDNENETIQFAHPHFHRGQPDLLALIQRKRNPPAPPSAEEGALLHASLSQDNKGQSQAVDVHSIVEGINAIRRQQQTISADLGALKQSNDALWKEAIEARERHAKHEDTINRILKFLAGLFGRVIQGHGNHQVHNDDNGAPPRRLMIGDGRASHGEGGEFHGSDVDAHSDSGSRSHTPPSFASERFATIETPATSVVSPAATISELHDPLPRSPSKKPQSFLEVPQAQETATSHNTSKVQLPSSVHAATSTAPSRDITSEPECSTPNPDAVWQATLQQLLSSPAQFQHAMQAFANAQPYNIPTDQSTSSLGLFAPVAVPQQQQQLTYALPAYPGQTHSPANPVVDPLAVGPAQSLDPQQAALLNNAQRLNKTYQDAAEIHADMDVLQSNMHTLIRDMGLDPNNISFPTVGTNDTGVPPPPGLDGIEQPGEDFSFDSWLNQIADTSGQLPDLTYPASPGKGLSGNGDIPGEDFAAFLDIPVYEGQPATQPATTAPPPTSPSGVKRKMEVVEVPVGDAPSAKKRR